MSERTTCVIAGGGPAGMVAGLILARSGVDVVVLEKHGDFLRDFRGDTIHPSTLQLLDELGLAQAFAGVPHSRVERAQLPAAEGDPVTVVSFEKLKHPYPYIAMAPQWDFLDLLADAAKDEPHFRLRMRTEVTGLVWDGDRVAGVRYRGPEGEGEIRATLTIAADGRWSALRRDARLPLRDLPVEVDVWWFRLDAAAGAGESLVPRTGGGNVMILIPRREYVQTAMLIRKGSDRRRRAQGIEATREAVATTAPEFAEVACELEFDDIKFLDVKLNRLTKWWRRGLLCIGDAAHAMSPVAGVGVNLAVQDGVAAATRLAAPLREGTITDRDVAAVQRRRRLPTVLVQAMQRIAHRGLGRLLDSGDTLVVPRRLASLLRAIPVLATLPARFVGIGVRPEHAPPSARR